MEEVWKDVRGHEGEYQVSNAGRVKSLSRVLTRSNGTKFPIKEKILSGSRDTKGYLQVELRNGKSRNIRMVHVIVAEAFIPREEGKTQVNHKDGNKGNNSVGNLEWVTCKENINHAWKNGLNKPLYGEDSKNHKLTEEQVRFIRENYDPKKRGFSARALAKQFGVSPYPILRIVHGKGWKHLK